MAMHRRNRRYSLLAPVLVLAAGTAGLAGAQAPHDITVVSEAGRDSIPVSEFSAVPMVPLAALAELVEAKLRPAAEQGVLVSANGKNARISDGRNFVPVEGKLVLLQSPARSISGQWFVPLDFLSKVLPALSKENLTYREADRMLIMGDSFPVLDVRTSRDPSYTRVEVTTSLPVPMEVEQVGDDVRIAIRAPYVKTEFRDEEILDDVVERISLSRGDESYEVAIRLGASFGTLKKFDRNYPEHGVVLDLLRSRVPGSARRSPGQIETIAEDLRSIEERGEETGEEATEETPPENVQTIELPPDFATATTPLSSDLRTRDTTFPMELRTVVLDPGHGGSETGAEDKGGLAEKDVTLSISRRLRSLLQDRLGLRVILTRDGDRNPSHDERTAIANNNKADVFVSIHADASPSREARGSSVYFLSYGSSEASMAGTSRSAARSSGGDSDSSLDFILWHMAQASHLSQSSRLAEIVQEELLAATGSDRVNRGIKQNTFRVLKGATMPAVLVEVGFISNPEEEQLLGSDAYQERVSEALYRGILRFKDLYDVQPRAEGASQGRQ
jgi:N-acetylmuramoyl-L-alanine amidase